MKELEACPNQADVPPDLWIECISCNTTANTPASKQINKPIKDGGSTAGLSQCNNPKDQNKIN